MIPCVKAVAMWVFWDEYSMWKIDKTNYEIWILKVKEKTSES